MISLETVPCRWRSLGEIAPDRYACASAKLSVSNGVSLEFCGTKCYCRDHEPVNSTDRLPPAPALTFAERAANFARAVKVELQWRAQGGAAPTDEEKAIRRAHCDANLCGQHDEKNDSCTACGCYLSARLLPPIPFGKLDLASQECPRGLWGFTGGYQPPAGSSCCGKKQQ